MRGSAAPPPTAKTTRSAAKATASWHDHGWFWGGILLVMIGCALVYGRSLGFAFIEYDDHQHIYENPDLSALDWPHLVNIWTHPSLLTYVPVTETLWWALAALGRAHGAAVNYQLYSYGLAAAPFHATSLALHLINTLLIIILARRLGIERPFAIIAGAFFALHPLQVEPVCWASAQRDLLSLMLALVAWHLWFGVGSILRWHAAVAATLIFSLAMFSKPATVIWPILALCLFRLGAGHWRLDRRRLVTLALWLAAALPVIYLAKIMEAPSPLFAPVPVSQRLLIALDSLGFYGTKIFWPWPLTPFYGRTPSYVLTSGVWQATTALCLLGGLGIWWRARVHRSVLPITAFFVVALLPYLGLIPFTHQNLSTVSDRYAYTSMLAPALGLALLLRSTASWQRGHFRRLMSACMLLPLALFGVAAQTQTAAWANTLTLMEHGLQVAPHLPPSWALHYTYGAALLKRQSLSTAEKHYKEALALEPAFAQTHFDLGLVYKKTGRDDAALAQYLAALAVDPNFVAALINTGVELFARQHIQEALPYLERACALAPTASLAHYNLGIILTANGRSEAAKQAFARAVDIEPDFAAARAMLEKLRGR